jgi:hypothetical protein
MNKNKNLCSYKIIEITGISAIGKTTYIKEHYGDNDKAFFNLNDFSNLESGFLIYRFFLASRLFFQSIFLSSICFSDIFWIFKAIINIRCSLLFRINIFRNCLLKFYYYDLYLRKSDKCNETLYVDEGISHIPFLLQDQIGSRQVIKEFYRRFSNQLSCVSVVCLNANVDTIERLMSRGHKRIKYNTHDEVKKFNDMNKRTLKEIIRRSDRYKCFSIIAVE